MEEVADLLGRHQFIVAGRDDSLEALLGTGPVLVEDLRLAQERLAEAGRDLVGAFRVVLAVTRLEVGERGLELVDDPVHQDLVVAVGRVGIAGEDVVHEGRGAPVGGQVEVSPGADDAGLGHALLLDRGGHQLAVLAIEVVEDEVALVDQRIELLVDRLDVLDGAVVGVAEFVHVLSAFATTVLLAAAPVELVAASVGNDVPGRIVDTAGVVERVDEFSIDRGQGGQGVFVGLVEVLVRDDAFLLDVQQVLVAGGGGEHGRCNG